MADAKISALTNLTAADPTNDMIPIVDVSETPPASGNTKRISINNILSSSPTASGALTVTGLVTAGSATITGALTVDTTTLVVNPSGYADRVGVGTATPSGLLALNQASGAYSLNMDGGGYGTIASFGIVNVGVSNNAYIGTVGNNPFLIQVANSTRATFDLSGHFNLANGNVVMATSGKGIDFAATTEAAGMTSELLNDYEEGTWVPVLTTDAVNFTSVGYFTQQAKYTKIGRLVTISGTIYTNSVVKGPASGKVVITGLPFAQPGGDVLGGGICHVSELWLADNPIEFLVSGSSVLLFKRATSTGVSVDLVVADVGTGANNFVRFSGQYYV